MFTFEYYSSCEWIVNEIYNIKICFLHNIITWVYCILLKILRRMYFQLKTPLQCFDKKYQWIIYQNMKRKKQKNKILCISKTVKYICNKLIIDTSIMRSILDFPNSSLISGKIFRVNILNFLERHKLWINLSSVVPYITVVLLLLQSEIWLYNWNSATRPYFIRIILVITYPMHWR